MDNLNIVDSIYKKEDFYIGLFSCLCVFLIFNSFIFILKSYYPLDKDSWDVVNTFLFIVLSWVFTIYLRKYNILSAVEKKEIVLIYFSRFIKYFIHTCSIVFLAVCFLYSDAKFNGTNIEFVKAMNKILIYLFIATALVIVLSIIILILEYNIDKEYFIKFYSKYLIYILTIILLLLAELSVPAKELINEYISFKTTSTETIKFETVNKIFFDNNIFLVIDDIFYNFILYVFLLMLIIGKKIVRFKDGCLDLNELIGFLMIFVIIFMAIQEFILLCGALIELEFNYQYLSSRILYFSWSIFIISILTSRTIYFINSNPLLLFLYITFSSFLLYFMVTSDKSVVTYFLMTSFFIIYIVIPEIVKKLSKKHKFLTDLKIGFHPKIYYIFNLFTACILIIILILFIILEFNEFVPIFSKLILLIFTFLVIAEDIVEKTFIYKILEIPLHFYYIVKKKP